MQNQHSTLGGFGMRKINRFKNLLKGKRKVVIAMTIVLLITLCSILYITYNEYRNLIINQQRQEMLGIAKSISQNIELLIEELRESLKIVTLDSSFCKQLAENKNSEVSKDEIKAYYEAKSTMVNKVIIFDNKGNILNKYPQNANYFYKDMIDDLKVVMDTRTSYIGSPYMNDEKNGFIINMYEPIYYEGKIQGVMAIGVRLGVVYDKLIDLVKIGEKGYAQVKDSNGTILMHKLQEQIGIDVIESRKAMHPTLDLHELEGLVEAQLSGKEGTAIYHSYWWADKTLKKVKKLNAYAPVYIDDKFWVVAVIMSYDEIQHPMSQFSIRLIFLVILIGLMIYTLTMDLLKMKKHTDELEREAKQLKILNEASEELRKKEAEIYHSQKLKMIGTLAGGIAHDINNLLTPILGYSELLLMKIPPSGEYYEEIDEIFKASQKGKELVEQILTFSRNDNGIVKSEAININEVTRQTLKLLKSVLPKKTVLKENIKKPCGYINANFTQIHQVIFNVCNNAYHAIKDNGGSVEVSLNTIEGSQVKGLSEERVYAELLVKDTGYGMDEETKQRIFEPFFTTKDIGEGTGLGLFVVQSIVDKYGGIILVESEIGKGSTFKVYFPLVDNEEEIIEKCHIFNNDLNKKINILIVDDNKKVIKVLKKSLEHLGYSAKVEDDSVKALKLIEGHSKDFEIIITDYMMPKLNGIDLARKVKKIKETMGIIIMTGYIDENIEGVYNNIVDGYILKPIEIKKLIDLINVICSKI